MAMSDNCRCPDGICHLGRSAGKETDPLCYKCIDLWFKEHLPHRIGKMFKEEGAESKFIVMRSLLQFLDFASSYNTAAKCFQLEHAGPYVRVDPHGQPQGTAKVTYEIRVGNLKGHAFDSADVAKHRQANRADAELLARFHNAAHVHTAHLTWGANHGDGWVLWDTDNGAEDLKVKRLICGLLLTRLYKHCNRERDIPWPKGFLP